jgi:hypothetical protein
MKSTFYSRCYYWLQKFVFTNRITTLTSHHIKIFRIPSYLFFSSLLLYVTLLSRLSLFSRTGSQTWMTSREVCGRKWLRHTSSCYSDFFPERLRTGTKLIARETKDNLGNTRSLMPMYWLTMGTAPSEFNIGLVDSNTIPGINVCLRLFCLYCPVCRYRSCDGLIPRPRSPIDCV